ncbi:MAG: hypothetical protein GC201_05960 [Alphaproteobacteria bacterium]|nr:hypothetical protein [Alphaproteobacteria bacterium]
MDAGRPPALIPALASLQDADGSFPCQLSGGGLDAVDRNGFAVAQVLRALGPDAPAVLGRAGRDAALRMLQRCRGPNGGFRFWPADLRPGWAPDLAEDADDTAIMVLLLWRAGWLEREDARRIACRTVVGHRLLATVQPGPPWARVGAFKTWLRPGPEPAIADCTVNANAVALLAALGLQRVPGYAEACAMIADAAVWAGEDEARAASLSPFYPEAGDLMLAVEQAVAEGAGELEGVLAHMRTSPSWRRLRRRCLGPAPAICGSPYGLVRWTCPTVGAARRLAVGLRFRMKDDIGADLGNHAGLAG